ncbi:MULTISPECIES: hypothetical protein [unclassified Streptomyces]|uniref:hypothetical protein n=1 Tax=unclassified Streptomyces TaxID=2593676 RepID=UPI00093AE48C|nr:hypothetical protein [Streptomyces sp. CB01883]OKJ73342.1 hypothetical protein AMK32_36990 [Streptomyces sp. CB01883]
MSASGTAADEEAFVRPARPERPPGYWERIDRIVAAAPPLSNEQKAIIYAAFHQPKTREAAA